MIIPQTKNGILNIDKPQCITSHDVVDAIRKIFPDQKVGHTGTLDPLATGVLPICIGEATKLSEKLTSETKSYSVKMLLGVETDTYDITGRIVFASVFNKDEIYIKERIKRFIGKQQQMPPKYSAIKVEGKKLYQYARENQDVEIKPREIEIFSIDNIRIDLESKEVAFDVVCSKGTYIRSLVNDIGKKIGCGATMTELRRTKTGSFAIEDSIPLYDFLKLDYIEMLDRIITIENYYIENKKITLSDDELGKFLNGVKLEVQSSDQIVRVYNKGKYIGLGTVEDKNLKRFIIE
ncbi:MAG: tRNA pseudouridine(55) synthase TruB [Clostridia bacterium]|nr:tRNA pseudouridine(55) synthase TruB [Clostridia bacterium]